MLPELIILGVIVTLIFGGKLDRLADLQVRAVWLFIVALLIMTTGWLFHIPALRQVQVFWVSTIIMMAEKFVYLAFALANRRLPGVKLIITGMVMNILAMTVNGGHMPANPAAAAAAFPGREIVPLHSMYMNAGTKLKFLCDIIPMHKPYAFMPGVYSLGDVVMTTGIIVLLVVMRTPSIKERKAAAEA